MQDKIFIKGARENNLKNIDVTIPRDALTVVTGLSGSGRPSPMKLKPSTAMMMQMPGGPHTLK